MGYLKSGLFISLDGVIDNSRSLHSSLGYRTPQEAHGGYVKLQLAV
jgi:hypothetical protein